MSVGLRKGYSKLNWLWIVPCMLFCEFGDELEAWYLGEKREVNYYKINRDEK